MATANIMPNNVFTFPIFSVCKCRYHMYDAGMITMENNEKGLTMTKNYIGYGFRGVRNDGRVFSGVVQDMRMVSWPWLSVDRTLVVIRQADNAHKSVYLEDMTGGHSFSLVNGQPFLVN